MIAGIVATVVIGALLTLAGLGLLMSLFVATETVRPYDPTLDKVLIYGSRLFWFAVFSGAIGLAVTQGRWL